jgi:hypothetical protein
METLSTFPGQWVYKPGKGNIADPLSRMPSFYNFTILPSTIPLKSSGRPECTAARVLWTVLPSPTDLSKIKLAYQHDNTFDSKKCTLVDGTPKTIK